MSDARILHERRQVVETARGFVREKARWRHRGRAPWAMDCIGLLVLTYRSLGLTVNDRRDYGREAWNEDLQGALWAHLGDPVYRAPDDGAADLSGCGPGDIAVLRWEGKAPCHAGILADYRHGGLSLIHAHSHFNVAEHGLDARWRRLLVEVYSPWQN